MLLTWNNTGGAGGISVPWSSTPSALLPPGFSLTRASTGTYFDSAGLLQTAAIDAARGTYRYNGSSWVFDGTIVEAAATNTCLQSEDLTTTWTSGAGVSVTANAYTAPTGAATMDRINASAGNTQHYLQILAGVVISAGTATFSFYFKYDNLQYVGLGMNDGTNSVISMFDILNGTAGTPAYFAGSGTASTRITSIGGGVFRAELTSTMSGSGASSLYVILGNSITAGIPTWNAAGTEKVGAWGGQVEVGGAATNYIPTTTAAVTRSADVVTAPTSGLLVNAQGLTAIQFRAIDLPFAQAAIVSTWAGTEGIPLQAISGLLYNYDGTSNVGGVALAGTPGVVYKAATSWGDSSRAVAANGTVAGGLAFDGSESLGTTVRIGAHPGGLSPASMVLQSLRLGTRQATDSELAGWTT